MGGRGVWDGVNFAMDWLSILGGGGGRRGGVGCFNTPNPLMALVCKLT